MLQFSISTPSFSITSFFEFILTPSSGSTKWQIQCQLPPFSFKISLKDTSFHISINSLGFYLSPECFLNFLSNLYVPPWLGKIFKFTVFTFLENVLNIGIFNHALPSPVKTPSHSIRNMKMICNIRFFIFCMFCIFFKYDGLSYASIM